MSEPHECPGCGGVAIEECVCPTNAEANANADDVSYEFSSDTNK